jgi:hypothetical protein
VRLLVVQEQVIWTGHESMPPVLIPKQQIAAVEVCSIQHYVIKFVSELQQVGGFPRVIWLRITVPIFSTPKSASTSCAGTSHLDRT